MFIGCGNELAFGWASVVVVQLILFVYYDESDPFGRSDLLVATLNRRCGGFWTTKNPLEDSVLAFLSFWLLASVVWSIGRFELFDVGKPGFVVF